MINSNSSTKQFKLKKQSKRKAFFSTELKKALLFAYYEARQHHSCVNLDFLLYGLLSQPKSLSSRLFSLAVSQFRNNENLTAQLINNRIQKLNKEKLTVNHLNEFSSEFLNENKKTPWLTLEVKEIIRAAIKASYQTKKKVVIVTTKHVLFALLNKEQVRASLRSIVD